MILLSLLLLGVSLSKSEAENVAVKTQCGTVIGNSYYFNGRGINRFLGIPFAIPPVGELRFRSPQPVQPWAKPLIAQTQPPACIQYYPYDYSWIDKSPGQSEDCLYMNIWAPKKKPFKKAKKAVMLWIHRGGFSTGSNRIPVYDGQVLAAYGDVIVVTVNYRVGIFGFLSFGTPDNPGNMGILDVLTALKWVNDNIEAFGGDKNRITVFGQSVGSIISGLLTMSPMAKGLFQRIIMESGAYFSLLDTAYIPSPQHFQSTFSHNSNLTKQMEDATGCSTTERKVGELPPDCFRKKDAKYLARKVSSLNPTSILNYLPILGDKVVPINPKVALAAGAFHDVDILTGFVQDEGSPTIVTTDIDRFGPYGEKDPKINKSVGRQLILKMLKSVPYKNQVADYYLSDLDDNDYDTIRRRSYRTFGDYALVCPTLFLAEKFSQNKRKHKTYLYYFNHQAQVTDFSPWMGVTHFSEVQFVFGRPLDTPYKYSPQEVQLSRQMLRMWTNFAKTGSPSAGWKQFSTEKGSYIRRFYTNDNSTCTLNEHLANCEFFRPYLTTP